MDFAFCWTNGKRSPPLPLWPRGLIDFWILSAIAMNHLGRNRRGMWRSEARKPDGGDSDQAMSANRFNGPILACNETSAAPQLAWTQLAPYEVARPIRVASGTTISRPVFTS